VTSELSNRQPAVLVQVVNDERYKKGTKLTVKIYFTGKDVVYKPYEETHAVSRKIKNNKRRQQLLQIEVEGTGGYIFCSASEKGEIEEIQAEVQRLQQLYYELKRKEEQGKAPVLLHRPATFLDRVFQENPIETLEKVVVDTRSIVKELEEKVGKE
ncbi:ribonuclease E/G, partial [Bacillus sp. S2-R3J1-FB-BA1]|uniref:ribonuclease E/G n=1 Tax=Bacillus sp. S2-R3J1-FB-BA1 TaxID=1973490 RepID=UPI001593DB7F